MQTSPRSAAEIRRLLGNLKFEHTPHAFRAGAMGMATCNELYPLFRRMPARILTKWMKEFDRAAVTHQACASCYCKALAYAALFTSHALPELSVDYTRRCYQRMRQSDSQRDYPAEVSDSLNQCDDPLSRRHRRYWRELTMQMQLSGRPPRA